MRKRNKNLFIYYADQKHKPLCSQYDRVFYYQGDLEGAEKLPWDFILYYDIMEADICVGKLANKILDYCVNAEEKDIYKCIVGHQKSDLCIKKSLLYELKDFKMQLVIVEKFYRELDIDGNVDYIPKEYIAKNILDFAHYQEMIPKWLVISQKYVICSRIKNILSSLCYSCALVFYPIVIMFCMKWRKNKKVKTFLCGVNIWSGYLSGSPGQRYLTRLLDKNILNEDDLIFLYGNKVSDKDFDKLEIENRNGYKISKVVQQHSILDYLKKDFLPIMGMSLKVILLRRKSGTFIKLCLKTIRKKILWLAVSSQYELKNMLYFQEPGSTEDILIQESLGIRTVFIYLSCCYFATNDYEVKDMYMLYYSHLAHNLLITSKVSRRFFLDNQNYFDKDEDVGILMSDFVRVSEGEDGLSFRKEVCKNLHIPYNRTLLCFCDTSMGKEGWLSDRNAAQLLLDIEHLVDSHQDYYLIYKSKFVESFFPNDSEVANAQRKLCKHKRIVYLSRLNTERYTAEDIMKASDLIISSHVSSTGFEAISGGKKVLLYSPMCAFNDLNSWVRNIDCINIFGYNQLRESVRFWLDQTQDNYFQRVKSQYKILIDTRCDQRNGYESVREIFENCDSGRVFANE